MLYSLKRDRRPRFVDVEGGNVGGGDRWRKLGYLGIWRCQVNRGRRKKKRVDVAKMMCIIADT
jgi:hypothetical protein